MQHLLAVLCLSVLLAAPASAGDPVVVLQETRTPVVNRKHRGIQHVALLKNVSSYQVRGLRVTVEFYDVFGKLLLARTAVPVPASLGPGETATLSVSTPALEEARHTRYRIEHAGSSGYRPRTRPRRGGRDPAGRGRPRGFLPLPV